MQSKDENINLIRKRDKDETKTSNCGIRLCRVGTEDITHIIISRPKISTRYYLRMIHHVVAKTLHKEIRQKDDPEVKKKIRTQSKLEETVAPNKKEYWSQ